MGFKKTNLFIDMSNSVHRLIKTRISDIINENYKDIYKTMDSKQKSDLKNEIADKLDKDLIKHNLFSMIEKYIKLYNIKQENIFLCFDDNSSSSWRDVDEENSNYKNGRNKDLSKFVAYWLKYMEDSIKHTNYNQLKIKYLEADDIIRLLCKKFNNPEEKNVVVSSDADFIQLMKLDNTFIYHPFQKKEIKVSKEEAQTLFLTKVITGDISDNIPSILPNNLIVDIPVRKRTENGMVETLDKIDISNIQFGDKTVSGLLKEHNNNWEETLKRGREKMFKKQSKKEEYVKYSLKDLEGMLKQRFFENKRMVDFDEIPEQNINDFNKVFSEIKYKNFTDEQIYDFYQKEKLYKISEKYKNIYSQPSIG